MDYILEIANKGAEGAIAENPDIELGVNIHAGQMRHLSRLTNGKGK
jgi:alanine dehydrogenase